MVICPIFYNGVLGSGLTACWLLTFDSPNAVSVSRICKDFRLYSAGSWAYPGALTTVRKWDISETSQNLYFYGKLILWGLLTTFKVYLLLHRRLWQWRDTGPDGEIQKGWCNKYSAKWRQCTGSRKLYFATVYLKGKLTGVTEVFQFIHDVF